MSSEALNALKPYDAKTKSWRVIIDTPKGSHNKYKFDEDLGAFMLSGVMPEGMSFPYDFGYLPGTKGEDGDPLDVLLLMDHPAFCGCIVESRLIGVIEAEQTEDGKCERNDRLVAVPTHCRVYSDCSDLRELNEHRRHEIAEFFVSYNRIRGKGFKVLDVQGPQRAEELIKSGSL